MALLDDIKEIDFSKCSRIQVEPSPNFFNLDIILQDGIPISSVLNGYGYANEFPIEHDEEYFNILRRDLGIQDDKIDIYEIGMANYMIVKPDGTSDIYSESSETGKIYNLAKKEVDLEITPEAVEKKKREIETTNLSFGTYDYEQEPLYDSDPAGNKESIISLFHRFKNFLKDSFIKINYQRLPASTINQGNNSLNTDSSNRAKTKRSSFATSINPNNPIYDHNTIVPMQSEPSTEKTIDVEEEINN